MMRYLFAAVTAALLASQAEAQVVVSTGGLYQPAGIYTPFGSVVNTSGYYTSGYYSPYSSSYYSPYSSSYYGGYYTPTWSGYSYPSYYNTNYYNSYYRPGVGMFRRGWRW